MFFFMICNKMGTLDPDWFHYFVIKSESPRIPDNQSWQTHNVVGFVKDEDSLEALKRLFMNSHMRELLSAGRKWPVIEGWR